MRLQFLFAAMMLAVTPAAHADLAFTFDYTPNTYYVHPTDFFTYYTTLKNTGTETLYAENGYPLYYEDLGGGTLGPYFTGVANGYVPSELAVGQTVVYPTYIGIAHVPVGSYTVFGKEDSLVFLGENHDFVVEQASSNITVVVSDNPVVAQAPEPSSLMLLGTGLIGALGALRRRFA